MVLFKEVAAVKKYISALKNSGKSIGFVPTMGALHSGHLSLIGQSRQNCAVTVCSIFVNPTQFNDPKDFEKYPVTIDSDLLKLEETGADIVFMPAVAEIYPAGLKPDLLYNLGYLENILEGFYRPGHFQGVCQVMHKLLEIIMPDELFMGRKDYQQCMVIKKLVGLQAMPINLIIGDTLREQGGLAMSSRNLRLSVADREKATVIFQALNYIKANIDKISGDELVKQATISILQAGFSKVDYVEIRDADTLLPAGENSGHLVALVAAFIGGVRLIDNMVVK